MTLLEMSFALDFLEPSARYVSKSAWMDSSVLDGKFVLSVSGTFICSFDAVQYRQQ